MFRLPGPPGRPGPARTVMDRRGPGDPGFAARKAAEKFELQPAPQRHVGTVDPSGLRAPGKRAGLEEIDQPWC